MRTFKTELPQGFSSPTELPGDAGEHQLWQRKNRSWWEQNPMRYDWVSPVPYEEFTKEFYTEIDRRFYQAVWHFAPWKTIPFDFLIDFDALKNMHVLEIGCGNGSHAQLLASHARSYTGIDITEYAVKSTSSRLKAFDLKGTVLRMDAEEMDFPDETFDFIWSWGVIHHSADTLKVLQRMNRVLKPGGCAITMVYHRGLWSYYTRGSLISLMRGEFPTSRSIHESIQRQIDGALARHYSERDWRRLVSGLFNVMSIRIYGQEEGLVLLPGGKLKNMLLRLIPDGLGRFLSTGCRMGLFLVARMQKN